MTVQTRTTAGRVVVSGTGLPDGRRQLPQCHASSGRTLGFRVVQRLLQEPHQAALAVRVRPHQPGLGRPHLAQRRPLLLVEPPRLAAGHPPAGHALYRVVHREDLEHRLQPAATDPGRCLDGLQRMRLAGAERVQSAFDLSLVRNAGGREVLPDPFIRLGRNQHREPSVQRARPADLLVVGHGEEGDRCKQKAGPACHSLPSAEVATRALIRCLAAESQLDRLVVCRSTPRRRVPAR